MARISLQVLVGALLLACAVVAQEATTNDTRGLLSNLMANRPAVFFWRRTTPSPNAPLAATPALPNAALNATAMVAAATDAANAAAAAAHSAALAANAAAQAVRSILERNCTGAPLQQSTTTAPVTSPVSSTVAVTTSTQVTTPSTTSTTEVKPPPTTTQAEATTLPGSGGEVVDATTLATEEEDVTPTLLSPDSTVISLFPATETTIQRN